MIARIVAAVGFLVAGASEFTSLEVPRDASRPNDELTSAAINVASLAPLDARPFRALSSLGAGSSSAIAHARLSRALARDPRDPGHHLQLAYHHMSGEDFAAAVVHLRVLRSIDRGLEPIIVALAAEGTRTPAGRRAVAIEFAGSPSLLRIMTAASALGVPSEELLELLSSTRIDEIPDGLVQAQSIVTRPLIAKGRYDEAYRLWKELLAKYPTNRVFDGDFQSLEGAAPFNWTYTRNQHVQASPISSNDPSGQRGLRIQIHSSDALRAAEQSIVLLGRRFQLRYQYQVDASDGGPVLRWELRCQRGTFVAESELQPTGGRWVRTGTSFQVSDGCSPLKLLLLTTGNRHAVSTESIVRYVRIDPA